MTLRHVVLNGVVVMLMGLVFVGSGQAQTALPHAALDAEADLSGPDGKALQAMQSEFATLKAQLLAALPGFPPDQQAAVNELIAKIDDKLGRVASIDVYFPSQDFDSLFAAYQDALGTCMHVDSAQVSGALKQDLPPGFVPPETLEALNALAEADKVQAATCASGTSRISLSTVYVHPATKAVVEAVTIIVATDQ